MVIKEHMNTIMELYTEPTFVIGALLTIFLVLGATPTFFHTPSTPGLGAVFYHAARILTSLYLLLSLSMSSTRGVFGLWEAAFNSENEQLIFRTYLMCYLDFMDTWQYVMRRQWAMISFLHVMERLGNVILLAILLRHNVGNGPMCGFAWVLSLSRCAMHTLLLLEGSRRLNVTYWRGVLERALYSALIFHTGILLLGYGSGYPKSWAAVVLCYLVTLNLFLSTRYKNAIKKLKTK